MRVVVLANSAIIFAQTLFLLITSHCPGASCGFRAGLYLVSPGICPARREEADWLAKEPATTSLPPLPMISDSLLLRIVKDWLPTNCVLRCDIGRRPLPTAQFSTPALPFRAIRLSLVAFSLVRCGRPVPLSPPPSHHYATTTKHRRRKMCTLTPPVWPSSVAARHRSNPGLLPVR